MIFLVEIAIVIAVSFLAGYTKGFYRDYRQMYVEYALVGAATILALWLHNRLFADFSLVLFMVIVMPRGAYLGARHAGRSVYISNDKDDADKIADIKEAVMESVKSDRCNCECHKRPGVVHFMACCVMCDTCGENIDFADFSNHQKECRLKK